MTVRWLAAGAVVLVGAAAFAGSVSATPATTPGFAGLTIAKATFPTIHSHVRAEDPHWSELIKTRGASDLYVQQNTWDPAACNCIPSTGWHTHPGPSLVIVTQGTVTEYDGHDRTCSPQVYTANTTKNSFVDPGGGHVHIIRNESGAIAQTIAVQLIPASAVRRQDAPTPPANCPF